LEYFYNTYEPGERSLDNAKYSARFIWESEAWEERVSPYLRTLSINDFRWNSWWCIENLFGLENPSLIHPKGVEFEVNGAINGVVIKGFIDRWIQNENTITISDYKTGKVPSSRYMEGKFFQLVLYALLLKEMGMSEEDFKLELLYLKDGVRKTHTPNETDYKSAIHLITTVKKEIDEAYEDNKWPAVPSRLCDWCVYKSSICSYWNKTHER
jgi:putative RecB family exonuclease